MVEPQQTLLADRFAEYVAELHELSGSHRLPHGRPEDLSQLLESLRSSEIFATEFGCIIRSIVLREHFRTSETEILTLVAVAWGGPGPDEHTHELSRILHDLGNMIRTLQARSAVAPVGIAAEDPEESSNGSADDWSETIRELEEGNPDVQMYRHLLTFRDVGERSHEASDEPSSVNGVSSPRKRESSSLHEIPEEPEHTALENDLARTKNKDESANHPAVYNHVLASEKFSPHQGTRPSATEILALGLAGLALALLVSVASLPIFRSRVSMYTPSRVAAKTDANGASSSAPQSASQDELFQSNAVTKQVAERLLALPHTEPILRQDILARGMRDLHLGGRETILYADLVAETARRVRVRRLQPQNLYEVTCDSWSAEFAAAFCNEFIDSMSATISSREGAGAIRTIDPALRPGIQVYPHWYLQGFIGLVIGCLSGVLLGFVKRPATEPVE